MSNISLGSLSLIASICLATPAFAVFDFQSDTVGSAPSAGLVSVHENGSTFGGGPGVLVADSASIPPDPFGGAGNKSLQMMKALGGGQDARVRFGAGDTFPTPIVTGTAEFHFNLIRNDLAGFTNPSLGLQMGSGNNLNQGFSAYGPIIQMRGFARDITLYEAGGARTLDQEVFPNINYHMLMDFDSVAKTFELFMGPVGGPLTQLTDDSGATTVFSYYGNSGGLDGMLFYNATGSDGLAFVDNISMPVPEPGALAAVSLLALPLLQRKRRAK